MSAKPVWVEARVCFYAKDEAEADAIHERMVDLACRGEIGMGLHVCQQTFVGGMNCTEVPVDEWREMLANREVRSWRSWFRAMLRRAS